MSNDDGQEDLFDDQPAAEEQVSEVIPKEAPETEKEGAEEEDQSGEETTSETPSEEQEAAEGSEEVATGKMIPEHRFKAAIKDVNDQLALARQKLAQYEATQIPDKESDPEGYDLHIRMEASKGVMREMKPDYQEVIAHYKTMADANSLLNEQVAKHPLPAKFAYDLAKKDLELKELMALKESDDYKEFLEFKKQKAKGKVSTEEPALSTKTAVASKVPNLNKATNVSRSNPKVQNDDDLFQGAL